MEIKYERKDIGYLSNYTKIVEKEHYGGSLVFELILEKNQSIFNLSLDLVLNHDITLIFKIIPFDDNSNIVPSINIKNLTLTQQNPYLVKNFHIVFENIVDNPNYLLEKELPIETLTINSNYIEIQNTYSKVNSEFIYISNSDLKISIILIGLFINYLFVC
jgi:hypothetical protein